MGSVVGPALDGGNGESCSGGGRLRHFLLSAACSTKEPTQRERGRGAEGGARAGVVAPCAGPRAPPEPPGAVAPPPAHDQHGRVAPPSPGIGDPSALHPALGAGSGARSRQLVAQEDRLKDRRHSRTKLECRDLMLRIPAGQGCRWPWAGRGRNTPQSATFSDAFSRFGGGMGQLLRGPCVRKGALSASMHTDVCSQLRCVTASAVRTRFSWYFNPPRESFKFAKFQAPPQGISCPREPQPALFYKFCLFEDVRVYTGRLEEYLFLSLISSFLPFQGKEA